nr:unnamed protein product [Digitaria exilis]
MNVTLEQDEPSKASTAVTPGGGPLQGRKGTASVTSPAWETDPPAPHMDGLQLGARTSPSQRLPRTETNETKRRASVAYSPPLICVVREATEGPEIEEDFVASKRAHMAPSRHLEVDLDGAERASQEPTRDAFNNWTQLSPIVFRPAHSQMAIPIPPRDHRASSPRLQSSPQASLSEARNPIFFDIPSHHTTGSRRHSPRHTPSTLGDAQLHSWHLKRDNRITRQAEHNLPLPGYPYALTLSPIGGEKHIPKQWPTTLKNTALSMTKITAIRIDHNTQQRLYTCTQLGLRLGINHKPPSKNGTLLVSRVLVPRKCESIPPELPIGGGAISPRAHEVTQKSSHPDIRSGCYYPHRRFFTSSLMVVVAFVEVVRPSVNS